MSKREVETVYDVLIVGSGAAGLNLALELGKRLKVAVLSKGPMEEGSTYYAQGGIAAVLDHADSIESHIEDTLSAGVGICDEQAVRFICEHAPDSINRLADLGVDFSRRVSKSGAEDFHLTQEGGHSHRRVVHAADATGRHVETTLVESVRAKANIDVFEHHIAVDVIRQRLRGGKHGRCVGAYVLNLTNSDVRAFRARTVVLATGGASKVYRYTSNPDGSTGDGIAIAWRAGCRVANMEFTQFHPTCLFHPDAKSFLITEALRGEGALLKLPDGKRFMDRFDKRGELAPRDIVARAIDHEIKRLGCECVYLDISHKDAAFITEHFPTVYNKCLEFGIDITKEPIPVVPAAHYTCGGVMTDLAGRTDVEGLYACGEVAYTGLHGANRMASNSLLECLVLSSAAAHDILQRIDTLAEPPKVRPWDERWVKDSDEEVVVTQNWGELRRFMWNYVGIVRTTKRLQRAKRRVNLLLGEIDEYYANFRITADLLELRNLATVADLIIRSAMTRTESRGLHYILDHPDRDDERWRKATVIGPDADSPKAA